MGEVSRTQPKLIGLTNTFNEVSPSDVLLSPKNLPKKPAHGVTWVHTHVCAYKYMHRYNCIFIYGCTYMQVLLFLLWCQWFWSFGSWDIVCFICWGRLYKALDLSVDGKSRGERRVKRDTCVFYVFDIVARLYWCFATVWTHQDELKVFLCVDGQLVSMALSYSLPLLDFEENEKDEVLHQHESHQQGDGSAHCRSNYDGESVVHHSYCREGTREERR